MKATHRSSSPRPSGIPWPLRLARRLGLARGLVIEPNLGPRPTQLLELYAMEECGSCRRVRRRLTELDLDFVHRTAPKGNERAFVTLRQRGGKAQVPYLVDPNRGVELYESEAILSYLEANYGAQP